MTSPPAERETVCPRCDGRGRKSYSGKYGGRIWLDEKCGRCNGTGRIPANTDTVKENEDGND